jgi:predicted lysophospholipase L1 biosynthesis ABC-type transport system permease subunit
MEEGRGETPGLRLMRLWLWTAPLAMLALAALFGWLAVDGEEWGLLAAMVVLALVAVGLFVVQWRLLRVYGRGAGPGGQDDEAR